MMWVDCDFSTPDASCSRCGFVGRTGLRHNCGRSGRLSRDGPGSQLAVLIEALRVDQEAPTGCRCDELRFKMNSLGSGGCRRQKDEITLMLRDNARSYGMHNYAQAIKHALQQRMTFINPFDVFGSLVDEAIRRADAVGC